VLAKVATAISEAGSNIDNVSMDEERGIYTAMHFTIQVHNRLHLARVMKSLRRIPEVVRITRIKDQPAR
jgi:GTP pyrophosphokinase